jgi:hypothetical protein
LAPGDFAFRQAIADGHAVEPAAGVALDADPECDPGALLVHLIAAGLATGTRRSR